MISESNKANPTYSRLFTFFNSSRSAKRSVLIAASSILILPLLKMLRSVESILIKLIEKSRHLLLVTLAEDQAEKLRVIIKLLKRLLNKDVLLHYFDPDPECESESEEKSSGREILSLLNQANTLIGIINKIHEKSISTEECEIPELIERLYRSLKNLSNIFR